MPNPGQIVVVDFAGAVGMKRRPAVVLSTELYHRHHPDVVVGLLTTNVRRATAPTDYVLQDWQSSGLHQPTAFRSYFLTLTDDALRIVGTLSERDWQAVQACLTRALALT